MVFNREASKMSLKDVLQKTGKKKQRKKARVQESLIKILLASILSKNTPAQVFCENLLSANLFGCAIIELITIR